jgi:hypothetical protein
MSKPMPDDDDMLEEYDFSNAEIGKYANRYAEGTNVVVLDPDVAAVFKTAEAVNAVLREHLKKTAGGGP